MGHTVFKIGNEFLYQISNTGWQWSHIFRWGALKDGSQRVIMDSRGRSLWSAAVMVCDGTKVNFIVDVIDL